MCGRFLIEVGVFFKFPDFLFAESLTVSVSHCFVCFSKQEWLLKLQQLTEELSTIDWIQFKITNPVSCFFPLLCDRRLNIFGLLTEHDIWGCQLGLCDTLIKSFREKTTHWLSSDYTVCLLVSALVSIIKHETGILIRAENMTWNELIAYDRSFGGKLLCADLSQVSLTHTSNNIHEKTGSIFS